MAAGDTQITIAGNLVDDPELRFTPAGQPPLESPAPHLAWSRDAHHDRACREEGALAGLASGNSSRVVRARWLRILGNRET